MNNMELETDIEALDMEMGDVTIHYCPVIPNPEGTPTAELKTADIEGTIYEIVDEEARNTLENKVDKEEGKGLSSNDYSDEDKAKLDSVENGAEVNVQSDWDENDNSKDDFIKNKPTKLSDFDNDEGFIDKTVDNLDNYYKKTETYTQSEVNSALSGKVDNSTLDNYYTKTETDTALGNKVDKVQGKGLSTNDYDDTAKGIVDGVTTALSGKVDKEEGYGLSANDYTDEDKALVGTIEDKLDKTETAVNANGLVITTPVNDNAPYIYRQTPVKESFKALMHKIVGASVVWNQLVDSNTTSVTIASGHRYIAKINGTLTFGTSDGTAITVSANDYLTDLTAMFGITIADYVYTLETSQSGSGIAWLQSYGFFTEDYYAYKQNKLESGCVSAKKIVGKNKLELTLEYLKAKNTSGTWVDNKYTLNGVTFTVNADMTISTSGTASANITLYLKDEGEDCPFINYKLYGCASGGSNNTYYLRISDVTTSSNSEYGSGVSISVTKTNQWILYIRILSGVNSNGLIFKPMITFSNENSTYEPYTETTYPISPITLRGLFKLSTDKLTVDGDEYNADGSVTRKYEQRAYQSGDESLTDAITDGTNTIVKLATPTTEQTTPFTETEIVGSTEYS